MQGARDNSIELGAFRSWPRPSDISEFLDHTRLEGCSILKYRVQFVSFDVIYVVNNFISAPLISSEAGKRLDRDLSPVKHTG
jgi:hypothetical protein